MSHERPETVRVEIPQWIKYLKWPGIVVSCGAAVWAVWTIPLKARDWADARWTPRSELSQELIPMKADIQEIKKNSEYTRRRIDRVLDMRVEASGNDRVAFRVTPTDE